MDAKTSKWPAFQVERREIGTLKPYRNNARTHSDEQVAQIAASIREWGWTQPILIDEKGGVLAGHGRLMAAQSLGIDVVPVIVARGWSKDQKRAYVLADNQLALNAGWDRDLLKVEIGALQDVSFDLSLVGFGDAFVEEVKADGASETGIEDAPASSYREQYGVIVVCADEAAQAETYETLRAMGLNCKVVTT